MEATNHEAEAEAEPSNQLSQESFTTPRPRTRQNSGPEVWGALSRNVGIGTQSTSSWTGTVQNQDWHSTALWCFGIAATSNPGSWLLEPLTFGGVLFGGLLTKLPIAVCSAPIWLPGFGV